MGPRMTPPAACNRLAHYCLSQPGHRTFSRCEYDPVFLHEGLCLTNAHGARVRAARGSRWAARVALARFRAHAIVRRARCASLLLFSEVLVEEPGNLRYRVVGLRLSDIAVVL